MSTRSLRTLWITRRDFGPEEAEMVQAWDDFSIEANYEGWENACKDALESIGKDLVEWRFIDVILDADKVTGAFDVPTLEGT